MSLVESDETCADLSLSPSQKCEEITANTKLIFGKGSDLLPLSHFKVKQEGTPVHYSSELTLHDDGVENYIDIARGPTEFSLDQVERENGIHELM